MSRNKVPDAWDDDDWNTSADHSANPEPPSEPAKLSKSERRARQAALNKKLWDEAEAPDAPYFVQRQDIVPLQSDIKPAVKVLSRKPAPALIAKRDPVSGMEKLALEDEEDEEDAESKPRPLTLEERQLKAQKERVEKQRKYEEVRERLFGSSNPSSGSNSPGNVTPPRGGKNRGRGGSKDSRPSSSSGSKGKQLFDPSYNPKPSSLFVQKQQGDRAPDGRFQQENDRIIRQPRAPDQSGRGGNGFSSRGRRDHNP